MRRARRPATASERRNPRLYRFTPFWLQRRRDMDERLFAAMVRPGRVPFRPPRFQVRSWWGQVEDLSELPPVWMCRWADLRRMGRIRA